MLSRTDAELGGDVRQGPAVELGRRHPGVFVESGQRRRVGPGHPERTVGEHPFGVGQMCPMTSLMLHLPGAYRNPALASGIVASRAAVESRCAARVASRSPSGTSDT